ncbi:YfzA family protein [Priestia endophytica]|uniref:YfzA family protein n=1 Tax=Priestia endophytica TaxID=135735 RepID=UPI00227ED7DC|nr:YfzA family protein [Priestia endophytica]MCY8234224.1 YfzA family protein [Priestia endophytica]
MFFARLSNSKFFTEWFTLYNKPKFNLFAVFFGTTLLPYAIIDGIKDLSSRK